MDNLDSHYGKSHPQNSEQKKEEKKNHEIPKWEMRSLAPPPSPLPLPVPTPMKGQGYRDHL